MTWQLWRPAPLFVPILKQKVGLTGKDFPPNSEEFVTAANLVLVRVLGRAGCQEPGITMCNFVL